MGSQNKGLSEIEVPKTIRILKLILTKLRADTLNLELIGIDGKTKQDQFILYAENVYDRLKIK